MKVATYTTPNKTHTHGEPYSRHVPVSPGGMMNRLSRLDRSMVFCSSSTYDTWMKLSLQVYLGSQLSMPLTEKYAEYQPSDGLYANS